MYQIDELSTEKYYNINAPRNSCAKQISKFQKIVLHERNNCWKKCHGFMDLLKKYHSEKRSFENFDLGKIPGILYYNIILRGRSNPCICCLLLTNACDIANFRFLVSIVYY